jgi:arylsulfatase A-like enzyme
VIRMIDSSIQKQDQARCSSGGDCRPTLILVCSDHGMTQEGSHGGPSDDETSAIAVFINHHFASHKHHAHHSFQVVDVDGERIVHRDMQRPSAAALLRNPYYAKQIDLTATLALLLGVPIPINNIGHLMSPVFALHNHTEFLRYMHAK